MENSLETSFVEIEIALSKQFIDTYGPRTYWKTLWAQENAHGGTLDTLYNGEIKKLKPATFPGDIELLTEIKKLSKFRSNYERISSFWGNGLDPDGFFVPVSTNEKFSAENTNIIEQYRQIEAWDLLARIENMSTAREKMKEVRKSIKRLKEQWTHRIQNNANMRASFYAGIINYLNYWINKSEFDKENMVLRIFINFPSGLYFDSDTFVKNFKLSAESEFKNLYKLLEPRKKTPTKTIWGKGYKVKISYERT